MARAWSRGPATRRRATARRRAAGTSPRTGRRGRSFHPRDAAALAACSPSSHAPCRRSGTTRGSGTGVTASSSTASAGLAEERDERAAREEAQVGAVEDAAVGVLEAPREELQAHPQVGDVRDRGDDEAVGGEGPVERDEGGERIAQMLEHVAVDDRVEGAGQGLRGLVEVGDHHLRAPAARPLGLGGIALERGHAPSLPGQELRQEDRRRRPRRGECGRVPARAGRG